MRYKDRFEHVWEHVGVAKPLVFANVISKQPIIFVARRYDLQNDHPDLWTKILEGMLHNQGEDHLVILRRDTAIIAVPVNNFAGDFVELPPERPKTPEQLRAERFK